MGLIDKIKNDVKKSGTNKGKIMFFKEGVKVRLRFLTDMDDGVEIKFHDSFEQGINVPCQEYYDRDCDYCDMEGLRTRSMYAWSVWDYEAAEVKLFLFAVNNCSPLPALMAMYENYGTLTDRDFVLTVSGKAQNKSFSVVPMDKVKFKNSKAKEFSEKKIFQILDKAFPADEVEEEEEKPKRSKKNNKSKTKAKEVEPEEDEWDDDEEESEVTYEDMSAKELYKLCIEREIDVEKKKSQKYYINCLEEYDEAHDEWDEDEEDDDEWED